MTPQLCHTYNSGDKLKFPVQVEPKYDGFRALCINGKFFSRTGKPLYNVDMIGDTLSTFGDFVFDGELMSKDWSQTAHVLRTQTKVSLQATYYVFDIMQLHEWSSKLCISPQFKRTEKLKEMFLLPLGMVNIGFIIPAPAKLVRDTSELENEYNFWLELGFEGVVIKDPNARYMFRRHKSWLKFKPSLSSEFVVVDTLEGTGKYVGMLGALIVDVDGHYCGIGTGFDDKQRRDLWITKPIGKHIEVRFQEMTRDGSLRFPSFLRMRPDMDY